MQICWNIILYAYCDNMQKEACLIDWYVKLFIPLQEVIALSFICC